MNNKTRITAASFLAYFSMSAMLAPIGIVSSPMAQHFGIDVTDATGAFSALTGGILIGAVAALLILDRLTLRSVFCTAYLVFAVALVIMTQDATFATVQLCLGAIGVSSGLGLPAAALTITASYDDARRSSMLVMTDGAFSVSGFVMPFIALQLLGRNFHWSSPYLVLLGVVVVLIALAATAQFPATQRNADSAARQRWPLNVWLLIAALFLYTLGQYTMTWWLPNHLITTYGASEALAGQVVVRFWQGMFVAQLLVAWWVLKAGTRTVLRIGSLSAVALMLPLVWVADAHWAAWLALVWGVANLGLLKMMLSFATQQIREPSPRLVSFILLGATCGTAVSPTVSSAWVALAGTQSALWFACACYVVMSAFILAATTRRRSR